MSWRSRPRFLGRITALFQFFNKRVPVIALNFYDPVLDRPAGAAFPLEFAGERFQFLSGQGNAGDKGDALPFAPLGLPSHPNDPVALGDGAPRTASAPIHRPPALRAHAAVGGGIDSGPIAFLFVRHSRIVDISQASETNPPRCDGAVRYEPSRANGYDI